MTKRERVRPGSRVLAKIAVFVASVLLALLAPGAARTARADDPEAAAELLAKAEADDEALRFADALTAYEAALAAQPSMARAMRAEARAGVLRAHAEGGFVPFAALERVRRDPQLASDRKTVDDLVVQADGFPPGLVRLEVWALGADAYATRMGRVEDALRLWRRIADDPLADPVVSGSALKSITTYELARGGYDAATLAAAHPRADAKLKAEVSRAVRRHRIHHLAIFLLGLAALGALLTVTRGVRAGRGREIALRARGSAPVLLGYAVWVGLTGAILASRYEEGTSLPFLGYGIALVPVLFLARVWGAAGAPTPAARGVRAALAAAAALGAAFLVLEKVDVTYLEGLGL